MQANEIISTEDASKILYVTPYTVRVYINKGLLKATKIGKRYLIRKSEVMKLLGDLV